MSRLTITQPITIPTQAKHRKIKKSYSNTSNYSSGNGNYYQPPQNDNKQNAENGNSPKPPKKKPGAGKIVAISLPRG